ncbi:T9SS type A sorting domain-containing protein [Psychroflexus tropicus]|uniref:T9SS type A sorting domain-containing protein n=1 Tax=Psychroflexus tropicus TaxID=197345 RepID=UPI00036F67B3|nr:T9SS type A sorting domain-containing protein [Psychroflexus tropicus]
MIKLISTTFFIFLMTSLQAQFYVDDAFKIVLKNSTELSISGNMTNNGTILGSGNLKLSGDNTQTISGTGVIENFSIDKSGNEAEVISGHQDVFRTFEIHGGTFKPEARLTLKSNDTLTAQIGQNTGGTILGDMVIERFIPQSNRAFRYFSSPVSTSESIRTNLQEGQNNTGTNYPDDNNNTLPGFGTHISGSKTGSNGFDATGSGNPSFFKWNDTNQSWNSISNTDVKTLSKAESFSLLIRGSRATNLNSNIALGPETTLRLTGNPSILNYNSSVDLNTDNSFVLLGNPYHATIDANLVLQRNPMLNSNYIYVYDPTLNTRGGYATVELNEGGTNQQGSEANQFIQGWQAVFVEALNTGPSSLNISFRETDKAIEEPQVETFNINTRINLKLLKENEAIDALSLKLKPGANSEVDDKDAKKLFNFDESIYIYSEGRYLSIEEREFPITTDTVRVGFYNKKQNHYQLKIEGEQISETDIVFKDFYLDKEYPLESTQDLIVDYEIVEAEPELRYGFVLKSETLASEDFTTENFQIYPNPTRGILKIRSLNTKQSDLRYEVYSLLSQKVAEGHLKNQGQVATYDASSLPIGVYLIVLTGQDKTRQTLKFIKH